MRPSQRDDDWRGLAEKLRAEIASIGTPSSSSPAAASRAMKTLDNLENMVERRLTEELDARRRRVVGPRAPERPTVYLIESSPRGDALTEKRVGVARPMKVPASLYNAVAKTIGSLSSPARFGSILEAVERAAGERVAPYTIRVPLRFWVAAGLITHKQARFAPIGPRSKFAARARQAWRQLDREPLRTGPDA